MSQTDVLISQLLIALSESKDTAEFREILDLDEEGLPLREQGEIIKLTLLRAAQEGCDSKRLSQLADIIPEDAFMEFSENMIRGAMESQMSWPCLQNLIGVVVEEEQVSLLRDVISDIVDSKQEQNLEYIQLLMMDILVGRKFGPDFVRALSQNREILNDAVSDTGIFSGLAKKVIGLDSRTTRVTYANLADVLGQSLQEEIKEETDQARIENLFIIIKSITKDLERFPKDFVEKALTSSLTVGARNAKADQKPSAELMAFANKKIYDLNVPSTRPSGAQFGSDRVKQSRIMEPGTDGSRTMY